MFFSITGSADEEPHGVIDAFKPESKDDFDKFKDLLHKKVSQYEVSSVFSVFLREVNQDCRGLWQLSLGQNDNSSDFVTCASWVPEALI